MTDNETAAAIKSLAYRIREREAAIRDGGEFADADVFALDFMTAMRGQGWRPTEAKVFAVPKPAPPGTLPPLKPETTGLLADLRADVEARAAAAKLAKEAARKAETS
jgi:hypothetical protein